MRTSINALFKAYDDLVDFIMSYESDTFSASASGLTRKRAEKLAVGFIADIKPMLDGDKISGWLEDII